MSTQKPYVRPEPPTKDQLRAMLAQAVRNTQPELNLAPFPAPPATNGVQVAKAVPAKAPVKGRKDRGKRPPARLYSKRAGK